MQRGCSPKTQGYIFQKCSTKHKGGLGEKDGFLDTRRKSHHTTRKRIFLQTHIIYPCFSRKWHSGIRPGNESFFKMHIIYPGPALVENGILVNKSSLQMSGIKYNCEECDYEASTPRNLKDHKRNPVISILSLFRYCLAFSFLVSLSLFKTIRVVPLIRPLGPLFGRIFTPTHNRTKENQLHPIFH